MTTLIKNAVAVLPTGPVKTSVLIGGGNGVPPTGATVRFQRSVFDKSTGRSEPLDSKIATLEFSYNPDIKLDEQDRLLNPLGFRVTNYRVDNDYAASPPIDNEVPASGPPPPPAEGQAGTGAPIPHASEVPVGGDHAQAVLPSGAAPGNGNGASTP